MGGLARLFGTIAVTALFCIPLALSLWALLDCARRPRWAWALSGRSQPLWMAAILCGFLVLVGGIVVSTWYLVRVRPIIADAERGQLPSGPR